VSCAYAVFSTYLSTCVARAACFVFCSISLTAFLFSFFLFYKFNRHLCHGAYWCTHNPGYVPKFLVHLHLHFSNSCVCASKQICAFPSSSIFIHTYLHFHMYVLSSVLYSQAPFLFSFPFSTNLIDTYVTVPIHVLITLLISLSSVSFCISIFVIHTYACVNLHMHFPPFSYPYTFIAILIYMLVSTIL